MRILSFLILASLLFVNAHTPQSPQESPELKEASELNATALKLFKQRKYGEALSVAKQALAIREKLLPPADPRISASLSYLCDIYIVKEDFDDAKRILDRLVEIQTQQSSADDASLAPTFDRLALVYYRKKDKTKAEELYLRAFSLREKAFGAESLPVAQSLFALGEFYRLEKDFPRAASSYKRSLLISGKVSGIHSPEFVRAGDAFTCLAAKTDKPAYLRTLLEIQKDFEDVSRELNEIRKQFAAPQTREEWIESGVLNGRAISLPIPDYPTALHDEEGIVIAKVEIDERGRVFGARDLCQGPPNISKSALEAARKARFTPTKIYGKPVKTTGLIVYNFRL